MLKNLAEFNSRFTFQPQGKRLYREVFLDRIFEHSIMTEIEFVSVIPVLEAISVRLDALFKEAFDNQGNMLNYDRVLDINGLLVFLYNFYKAAEMSGNAINKANMELITKALDDLEPYVTDDPYTE